MHRKGSNYQYPLRRRAFLSTTQAPVFLPSFFSWFKLWVFDIHSSLDYSAKFFSQGLSKKLGGGKGILGSLLASLPLFFSVFGLSSSLDHHLHAPLCPHPTKAKSSLLLLLPGNLNFTVLFRSYKEAVT